MKTKVKITPKEKAVLVKRLNTWKLQSMDQLEDALVTYVNICHAQSSDLATACVLVINRLIEQKAGLVSKA